MTHDIHGHDGARLMEGDFFGDDEDFEFKEIYPNKTYCLFGMHLGALSSLSICSAQLLGGIAGMFLAVTVACVCIRIIRWSLSW